MILVHRLKLLLIIPIVLLFIQCNNNSSVGTTPPTDESPGDEDTSRRAAASAATVRISTMVENALVFHIDDSMQTGQGYKATLALGREQVLADLKKEMEDATGSDAKDLIVDTALKVAAQMRARLKDLSPASGRSFDISPMSEGNEIQDINEETGNKAFWQWNVVPLKEGKHQLELVVEVVLNKKQNVFLPSKTIPVTIYAKSESFLSQFSGFMQENWKWMITAIIIPIFIAWLTTRIRQRQQAANSQQAGDKKK